MPYDDSDIRPSEPSSDCSASRLSAVRHALRGVVIDNASVLGVVGVGAGLAPYVAAKHGVAGLGGAAALEYAQTQVRINTIAPGGVDTPHFRATFGADQAGAGAFAGMHPMRRLATEDEIASLVVSLASDGAAFIHGATLAVDGGLERPVTAALRPPALLTAAQPPCRRLASCRGVF